jgi:TPR repeat protein
MLYLGMVYTTGAMFEPDIIGISMLPFHKTEYRDFSSPLLDGYVPDFEEDEERRYSVVAPDAREAFLYFRKASRQDSTYTAELVAKGKFLYAKCFLDGLGVDFDLKRGVRLMLAAGKSGSADAVAFLGEHGISPEMFLGEGRKHED